VLGFKAQPKCFDLLKSGQKCHATLFNFKKWCPTFAEKHMNPFLEVTPKKVFFMGENLLAKVTKNFRQVWGASGNNPSRAQKFSCFYTYVQGLAKNMFAGGTKSGKISFSPLETKKTTFFA